MKEESITPQPSSPEDCITRKERRDKIRAIRKFRTKAAQPDVSVCSDTLNSDTSSLTKEERAQRQKLRNREAAQKSRESHKKFVDELKAENQQLKQALTRRQYCRRCQCEIQSGLSTDEPEQTDAIIEDPTTLELENDQVIRTSFEEEDYYQIINDVSSHQRLGMNGFMLALLITVGILFFPSSHADIEALTLPSFLGRQLMELPVEPGNTIFKAQQDPLSQILSTPIESLKPFPIAQPPSIVHNSECLKQILQPYTTQQLVNLRGISGRETFEDRAVLFCDIPRVYRQNKSGELFSRHLNIVVSGSQVQQIVGDKGSYWLHDVPKWKGLYRIEAEVLNISEMFDQNCLE